MTFNSLFVLLVLLGVVNAQEYAPVIQTETGRLRGLIRESENGTRVYFYQGVRYGTARRFGRAQIVGLDHFHDAYNATHVRYACPQPGFPLANGSMDENLTEARYSSEDCLYLNIWVPASAIDEHRKLPVMFWIHGGSFKSGNIFMHLYDGRHLAALGDVIVVSVNYRLAALGFISDGEHGRPESGNLGLFDMLLATHWVHHNIAHFGGDPQLVTLFGESAGSMAVGALAAQNLYPKFFKRIIMQSGVPNAMVSHQVMLQATEALAKAVACPTASHTAMITCLRGKDVDALIEPNIAFQPLFGDALLPSEPLKLIHDHKTDIDVLIGFTQDEASYFVRPLLKVLNVTTVAQAKEVLATFFPQINNTKVLEHYFGNLNSSQDVHKAMETLLTDGTFKCPTFDFVRALTNWNTSHSHYLYELKQAVDVLGGACHKDMGVCHSADLAFMFGQPISHRSKFLEADYRLSREMIRLWSTFAKTGKLDKVDGRIDWLQACDGVGDVVNKMNLADGAYKLDRFHTSRDCEVWKGVLYTPPVSR